MRNVNTHPALLEEIRRTTIMFGSDELLFSKAATYRPPPARSCYSNESNDLYEYHDEYEEVSTFNQREACGKQTRPQDRASSTTNTYGNFVASKRLRDDDDVQIVKIKEEKEKNNTLIQENEELNFRNNMMKQRIEHAEI